MLMRFVIYNDKIKQNCLSAIEELPRDGKCVVSINEYKSKRSLSQNSLLWLWNTEIASFIYETTGNIYTPEEVHEWMKEHFLPAKVVEINGEAKKARRSTASLNTKEMAAYLSQLEYYCGAELGLTLPRPEEYYMAAMGL